MLMAALIFFTLAAIGGATMAVIHIRGGTIPLPLALGHGALAAIGLILLIIGILQVPGTGLFGVALGIFILAALGGLYLFTIYLRGGSLPTLFIFGHGTIAAIALIVLIIAVWRG
jgi:hypothetical protein